MRLPNIYEFATVSDWYTGGWQNRIGISGIGYDENLVTRDMTDKSSIKEMLKKTLKRMMVSGMTDDSIFRK